ncbi:MAG: glycosyltransferase family 4 protein [Gammaproteobacteria bacterium]
MRVGIDGRALTGDETGIGRYVREICARLDGLLPQAEFFVYSPFPLAKRLPSPRWIPRIAPRPPRYLSGYAWFKLRSHRLIHADQLDVFWANRTLLPPLRAGTGALVTVHDLNHLLVPETMPVVNRWAHRLWFARDVRRADRVIANSHATARRLRRLVGCEADGIAPPGVAAHFAPAPPRQISECLRRYGISSPYFLAVGTLEPRKNYGKLFEAFQQFRRDETSRDHLLIVSGAAGWKEQRLKHRVAETGIRMLGYVADADLPALYSGAEALVFPSRYEGFGMPAAEARACGTRLIASDIPELREAGGADAIYIEPSVQGIVCGLRQASNRPRPPPIRAPSWDAAAAVMAQALMDAARVGNARGRMSADT